MIKKITLLFFLTMISLGFSQELLTNGDFETGDVTGWIGNAANVVTDSGNSYNEANVATAGNPWDVNLSQVVAITNGTTYILTFDAWSDGNRTMVAGIGLNEDPWTNVTETVNLTSTSQNYSLTFVANFELANSRVLFDMGAMTGFVGIDNVSLVVSTSTTSINLPIDFETEPVTTDFIDFDGGTASVITNPQSGGINTSATVAQIVRNGGQVWAGSKIVLANNLDFSTQGGLSMKVFTTAPIGTTVKFKLEGTGETEVDMLTTVTGAWETLTWDFTGQPTNFNTLVFMFDFGNVGDGSATSTFLFDDIEQVDATGGLTQIDLPVDFEGSTTNFAVTDFGGNTSSMVVDPDVSGNMVIQSIKTAGAATWAGTTIGTAAGFATNIPLTLADSKMNLRVWSPDAGTPIRLKVEDSNDATHTCETEINTTVAGGWETLEFDFTNQAPGTESLSVGLSMGWVYNKASIFFNFGTDGATAGEKTYYFDDVKFGSASTASLEDLEVFGFRIYPNPTTDRLQLKAASNIESIEIFDIVGRRMLTDSPNALTKELNISNLSNGIYFVRVAIDNAKGTTKIIKR